MKNIRPIYYFINLFLLTLIFISCKRDKVNPYLGEQACPDDNFKIVSGLTINKSSSQTVNFQTTDSLYFTASFSSTARWKIVITGENSHASATLEGLSSSIDTAWYGRPGNELFFANEKVTIDFQIVCRPDLTSRHSVNIIKPNFKKDPYLFLVTNFNAIDAVFPANWIFYPDGDPLYGTGIVDSAWCPFSSKCTNYEPSQEGGGYLSFIGIKPIPGGESKNDYGTYEIYPQNISSLNPDPSKVWFNFLANTQGTAAKVIVTFRSGSNNKGFGRKVFTIKTSDWKMYSLNLGNMDLGVNDVSMPTTQSIGILFITVIQSEGIAPTYFNMDVPCFTIGSSFYGVKE
jgi:hypothetical protein